MFFLFLFIQNCNCLNAQLNLEIQAGSNHFHFIESEYNRYQSPIDQNSLIPGFNFGLNVRYNIDKNKSLLYSNQFLFPDKMKVEDFSFTINPIISYSYLYYKTGLGYLHQIKKFELGIVGQIILIEKASSQNQHVLEREITKREINNLPKQYGFDLLIRYKINKKLFAEMTYGKGFQFRNSKKVETINQWLDKVSVFGLSLGYTFLEIE